MEMMMIQWMITIQERKKEEKTQNESDKNGCSLEKNEREKRSDEENYLKQAEERVK